MMRLINLRAAVVPHQRKELLFWLALVLSFRCNFAITQNYQVESLDDTRIALMSYATGSSKPGGNVPECVWKLLKKKRKNSSFHHSSNDLNQMVQVHEIKRKIKRKIKREIKRNLAWFFSVILFFFVMAFFMFFAFHDIFRRYTQREIIKDKIEQNYTRCGNWPHQNSITSPEQVKIL